MNKNEAIKTLDEVIAMIRNHEINRDNEDIVVALIKEVEGYIYELYKSTI